MSLISWMIYSCNFSSTSITGTLIEFGYQYSEMTYLNALFSLFSQWPGPLSHLPSLFPSSLVIHPAALSVSELLTSQRKKPKNNPLFFFLPLAFLPLKDLQVEDNKGNQND